MGSEVLFPVLLQWGDGELEVVDRERFERDPIYRHPSQFLRVIDAMGSLCAAAPSVDGEGTSLVPKDALLDEQVLASALEADPMADPVDARSIWTFGEERPMQRLLDYVRALPTRFRRVAEPCLDRCPEGAALHATHRCKGWHRVPDVDVFQLRVILLHRRSALEARAAFVRALLSEGEWFLRASAPSSAFVRDPAWQETPDHAFRVPTGVDAQALVAELSGREWLLTRGAVTPSSLFEAGWSPAVLLARHLSLGADAALAGETESGPWCFAVRAAPPGSSP